MARRKSFGQVGNGIAAVLGVGIFLVWAVPAMLSANASDDWQTAEGGSLAFSTAVHLNAVMVLNAMTCLK